MTVPNSTALSSTVTTATYNHTTTHCLTSIPAAICSRASDPQHGSRCPARIRPAMMPATMAALDDPRPRAYGIRLTTWYLRVGIGFLAASKAALTPTTMKLLLSFGICDAPSPSATISNLSARSTVTSDHKSTANPKQSSMGGLNRMNE